MSPSSIATDLLTNASCSHRQAFSWYTVNNIFLANILRVTEEGHLVQVELLNIFEEQENVDDHMINRRLAQKVAEELQVKVPESVADSSEESVLDAATASCSVTDQATGFTTASVTESVDPVDPADRTQNSSFEVE